MTFELVQASGMLDFYASFAGKFSSRTKHN